MSILKTLMDYIAEYGNLEFQHVETSEEDGEIVYRVLDDIQTDITDENIASYALSPSGNAVVSYDIIGNKTYQNSYVFYAKEAAADEIDRRDNYNFLEDFSEWLEDRNDTNDLPKLSGRYRADSIEVSNAMLFDTAEDGTGLYQIQIQFIYTKEAIFNA